MLQAHRYYFALCTTAEKINKQYNNNQNEESVPLGIIGFDVLQEGALNKVIDVVAEDRLGTLRKLLLMLLEEPFHVCPHEPRHLLVKSYHSRVYLCLVTRLI